MMPHRSHLHFGEYKWVWTNLSLDVLGPYTLFGGTMIRRVILVLLWPCILFPLPYGISRDILRPDANENKNKTPRVSVKFQESQVRSRT